MEELYLTETLQKEAVRIQIRVEKWPKVAAILTIRVAVWYDARTKNTVQ